MLLQQLLSQFVNTCVLIYLSFQPKTNLTLLYNILIPHFWEQTVHVVI